MMAFYSDPNVVGPYPVLGGPPGALRPAPQQVPLPAALPARTAKAKGPGLFDRLFGGGIPNGLLSAEDKKSARKRALLMGGLAAMHAGAQPFSTVLGSLSEGLATALQGGQAGYQQAAEGALAQQELARKQQIATNRESIYQKYPPQPNESGAETLRRYAQMLPEFLRTGDTDMAGKITEILKSVGGEAFGLQKPGTAETPHEIQIRGANGKPEWALWNPKTRKYEPTGQEVGKDPNAGAASADAETMRRFTRENQLVDDYQKELGPVFDLAMKMRGASKDASLAVAGDPTSQIQLLYTFITAMDPRSTVREGEVGLVARAMPYMERAQAMLQGLQAGKSTIMPPEFAKAMADLIARRSRDYARYVGQRQKDYTTRAARWGVDPTVFRGLEMPATGNAGNVDALLGGGAHGGPDINPMTIPIPPALRRP